LDAENPNLTALLSTGMEEFYHPEVLEEEEVGFGRNDFRLLAAGKFAPGPCLHASRKPEVTSPCELDHFQMAPNDSEWRGGHGMRQARIVLARAMLSAILITQAVAAPFVLFPKATELASPDGRFVVRNLERKGGPNEFVGTSLSLWLVEKATGRSLKLCDYIGVAAVAWFGDYLVVTEYVGKKTSRALVFSVADAIDSIVLDKRTLLRVIPVDLRETLRQNDHVFVEASGVNGQTLHLRVWGYGQHDANGFQWHCEFVFREGTVSCSDDRPSR
jgi:hypothetical protein